MGGFFLIKKDERTRLEKVEESYKDSIDIFLKKGWDYPERLRKRIWAFSTTINIHAVIIIFTNLVMMISLFHLAQLSIRVKQALMPLNF